jgi:hypothetical protein
MQSVTIHRTGKLSLHCGVPVETWHGIDHATGQDVDVLVPVATRAGVVACLSDLHTIPTTAAPLDAVRVALATLWQLANQLTVAEAEALVAAAQAFVTLRVRARQEG